MTAFTIICERMKLCIIIIEALWVEALQVHRQDCPACKIAQHLKNETAQKKEEPQPFEADLKCVVSNCLSIIV